MRTDYLVRLLVALGLQQMNLEVQVLWAVNVSPGPGLGHWHLDLELLRVLGHHDGCLLRSLARAHWAVSHKFKPCLCFVCTPGGRRPCGVALHSTHHQKALKAEETGPPGPVTSRFERDLSRIVISSGCSRKVVTVVHYDPSRRMSPLAGANLRFQALKNLSTGTNS